MNWRYLGLLSDARNSGCSGVYLIVHRGIYDRIVYVGVSSNVGRRISEHYEGYLRGNRTIFNAGSNDDVYALMSAFNISNHTKHYQNLAKNYAIWASTTVYADIPQNLLAKTQNFSNQWHEILLNKYLPQLVVWALPFSSYSYEIATKIESVIQKKLIDTFDLRGFFNVKQLSILGKIEHPNLNKISLDLLPLDLDPVSRIIFRNLNQKTIPADARELALEQLSFELQKREQKKQINLEKLNNTKLRYSNHGKPWTHEDLEKLRVMIVDFDLTPAEISHYLARAPRSIAKRVIDNDKISNRKWREHLKWL